MPSQEESKDGIPRKDEGRPLPDVEQRGDSAELGRPAGVLSDRSGPRDPSNKRK